VLCSRAPVPPAELRKEPGALATPATQPETAAAYARATHFMFGEEAEGQFVADNVPPGNYELGVDISMEPAAGGAGQRLQARTPVFTTVPTNPPNGTLDLGEIVLQLAN